jgi:hypothetical protein
MPDTYTIAAAARLCHVDRRTLQRALHRGTLHLDADHRLSQEELLNAGYLVTDAPQVEPQTPLVAPQETPQVMPQGASLVPLLERLTTALEGVWQELHHLRTHGIQTPQGTPLGTPLAAPLVPPLVPPLVASQPPARVPEPTAPPYDPTKYVLGRLCRRGHEYGTTGKTLLRLPALQCRQCQAERARERRRAKREGAS